jgi:type II secretory pathway pseudopilin PulG
MNVIRQGRNPAGADEQPVASDDRGAALVLALGVMLAISVILAALLSLLSSGIGSTIALQRNRNAQYAADGAMEQAINALQRDGGRALVGGGCTSANPTLAFTVNQIVVTVACTGEPIAVVVTQTSPTNPQTGIVLQRNVVLSSCAFAGACNPDTATIVAKVNFPTAADGTPSGAFVQSWSVTG